MKKEEAKELLEKFLEDKPNFREEHPGQDEEVYRQMDRLTEALYMAIMALNAIEQVRWERDTAIQQLTELGYGLGEKPSAQPVTITPESSAVKLQDSNDTISRQAAIDMIRLYREDEAVDIDELESSIAMMPSAQLAQDCISRQAAIDVAKQHWYKPDIAKALEALPSAHPEIIHCRDCKNWDKTWTNDFSPNYHYCPMVDGVRKDNFYCADAERRTDERID